MYPGRTGGNDRFIKPSEYILSTLRNKHVGAIFGLPLCIYLISVYLKPVEKCFIFFVKTHLNVKLRSRWIPHGDIYRICYRVHNEDKDTILMFCPVF